MEVDNRIDGLKVNYLIIFLSGLVLLVGGILVFMLVIQSIFGRYSVNQILPTPDNLAYIFSNESRVGILYSKYTENRFGEGNTWISDNVSTWEQFCRNIRAKFEVISDQDIETGKHMEYKLIILPTALALSDKQEVQLKRYIDNGGSVLATSGTGTLAIDGKWKGWRFFSEVFGMDFTKELTGKEQYKIHTLRGNLPVTAGVPTGYTLKIATWDRPIYSEILEPRAHQISFWYDFRGEDGLVREEIKKSAGMAYGTYGKGRFVWMGFEYNSVIGQQEDYIIFDKLLQNCFSWLTYQPTVSIKDWPAPYEAAVIFIPVLEEQIGNINALLPLIKRNNFPADFFMNPEIANTNPDAVKKAAGVGTIGAITDVGFVESVKDTSNQLFDLETQNEVLFNARETILNGGGKEPTAFSPVYGFFNENTRQAMVSNGYDILLTDSLTDRSVPVIDIRDETPIITISKTARDDYTVIRDFGLTETDFQRYTYEEDIDRILFEGGLFVFKIHSQYQMQPQNVSVVEDVLKYAKNNNMWIASIDDLKKWWIRRGKIELKYDIRSERRFSIEISNPADFENPGFIVQINLNKPVSDIEISSDIINTKLPDYEYAEDSNILYLNIKNLEAGGSRSYIVDYENLRQSRQEVASK